MNGWLKSAFGISAGGLIVLLATNGAALGEALLGLWLVLLKFSETAPLGLTSFLLALALAIGCQHPLRRFVPHWRNDHLRELAIESVALGVGILVMRVQMPELLGLMLGGVAGFMAPYLYKLLAALGDGLLHAARKAVTP